MARATAGRGVRRKGMAFVSGGTFAMGSDRHYPEEAPVRRVTVGSFWMDDHPVTNLEFLRFVKATGHVTLAEQAPDAAQYPDAKPEMLFAGSVVFEKSMGPVDLSNHYNWWAWRQGADWRHPEGPGTTVHGRERHPVVHVAFPDAEAYATWADKELPTEAEWECAARGGLDGAEFAWGDELMPKGRAMANTWQGEFPYENTLLDGYEGTSPVGAFPPNGYGLHDMTGNVWEWTSDYFTTRHADEAEKPCCGPRNPRVTSPDDSFAVGRPGEQFARRVIKGGSHLCAPNYCLRYRPAARQGHMIETSTGHLGFRCIVRTG
jgi:formylglycine-generating enzyme